MRNSEATLGSNYALLNVVVNFNLNPIDQQKLERSQFGELLALGLHISFRGSQPSFSPRS